MVAMKTMLVYFISFFCLLMQYKSYITKLNACISDKASLTIEKKGINYGITISYSISYLKNIIRWFLLEK